jgi:hypothetical protein
MNRTLTSKQDTKRGRIPMNIFGKPNSGRGQSGAEMPKINGVAGTLVFAHGTTDSAGRSSPSRDEGISEDIVFSRMEKGTAYPSLE